MNATNSPAWLSAIRETVSSYRNMIDATVEQLTDAEVFTRPASDINSVAIILRHLGGNLQSRWTDFQTTDGEKPDRNRDTEFLDWDGDRASLVAHFDRGWRTFQLALDQIDDQNATETVYIRGEPHSVLEALVRSVTHITYHAGQIAMTARMIHDGEWHWLTIAPNASTEHNDQTWGTGESRGGFSDGSDAR